MVVGNPQPGVNPGPHRPLQSIRRHVDIFWHGARQPADGGILDDLTHFLDSLEVSRRGDGKARFDYIHSQPLELACNLDLLVNIKRSPGRLLPITERGIKNVDSSWHLSSSQSITS